MTAIMATSCVRSSTRPLPDDFARANESEVYAFTDCTQFIRNAELCEVACDAIVRILMSLPLTTETSTGDATLRVDVACVRFGALALCALVLTMLPGCDDPSVPTFKDIQGAQAACRRVVDTKCAVDAACQASSAEADELFQKCQRAGHDFCEARVLRIDGDITRCIDDVEQGGCMLESPATCQGLFLLL